MIRAVHHEQKLTQFTALEPGTLVKDGYFSLMASVGSIEVRLFTMDGWRTLVLTR